MPAESDKGNSLVDRLGQVPCARTSLLSGIASGVGFGIIRGLTTGPWVAFNWTMGSFLFVSLGTWTICRARIRAEHERMQVLVDSLPNVRRRQPEQSVNTPPTKQSSSTAT